MFVVPIAARSRAFGMPARRLEVGLCCETRLFFADAPLGVRLIVRCIAVRLGALWHCQLTRRRTNSAKQPGLSQVRSR